MMIVKDLIKQLQELNPQDTVGVCFYDGDCGMFTFGDIRTLGSYESMVDKTTDNVISKCNYYIN